MWDLTLRGHILLLKYSLSQMPATLKQKLLKYKYTKLDSTNKAYTSECLCLGVTSSGKDLGIEVNRAYSTCAKSACSKLSV